MFSKLGYQTFKSTENNLDALGKIVENISNVNSLGYKRKQASFVEALNGEIAKHESKDFSQGPLRKTGDLFDLALDGPGFFEVELQNGQRAFSRAGRFKLNNEGELVTEEGYRVIPEIETNGKPVLEADNLTIKVASPKLIVPVNLIPEISEDGTVNGINEATGEKTKIGKINVVAFNNPQGLESIGKSYYLPTNTSGPALEVNPGLNSSTKVKQGYLEFGNINTLTEFLDLSKVKNLLSAQFKVLKAIDKIYEAVHYTVSKNA